MNCSMPSQSDQNSPDQKVPAIVWFRDDLRLADNPALSAACETGHPIVCIYIYDAKPTSGRPLGGAALWWLHHTLTSLGNDLRARGSELLIFAGPEQETLSQIAKTTNSSKIFWNRRYHKSGIATDKAIKASLHEQGITCVSFNSHLLYEPWQVTTKTGDPMKVFTPFWRAARERGIPDMPLPSPEHIASYGWPDSADIKPISLDDLNLLPTNPDWSPGFHDAWTPGETGAKDCLNTFLDNGFAGYAEDRNRPDMASTSRLSPHLRFGEISPRQIWYTTEGAFESGQTRASPKDLEKFFSEIGWREFAYHLMFHNPDLATVNFQSRFNDFPWGNDDKALKAWQRGRTGYPIVDAGMRELWTTGWMHNRVRMIVASFLIKHLMIDWRQGEAWFWDTLVDADPANNAASWQWVAGSGADAAPYFRIFNPIIQGEKFDPNGDYVRRWVPELSKLRNDVIHKPWLASAGVLAGADVKLGVTYPRPVVDHDAARTRALAAFQSLKSVA
jgi:deoxyribodipyrimidine photo-lyase